MKATSCFKEISEFVAKNLRYASLKDIQKDMHSNILL